MTKITMTLQGQTRLEALIDSKIRGFETDILKAGNKMTEAMVKKAKSIVPVDTGALQASIEQIPGTIRREGLQPVIEFGFKSGSDLIDYDIYVEWGTSKMKAQPFMRPTAKSLHPLLLKRLGEVSKLNE